MIDNLSPKSLETLEAVYIIVLDYKKIGLRLTFKQIYYQLVLRGIITNKKKEYKKLKRLLENGSVYKFVDLDSIEEGIFVPGCPDVQSAKLGSPDRFITNGHLRKPECIDIELWSEKEELFNMLYKIAQDYGINLVINPDLTSYPVINDACERIQKSENPCTILYLGDYSFTRPDIAQEIEQSLRKFNLKVEVQQMFLTFEQVLDYDSPLNPAKKMNPKAETYFEKFEGISVEVESLEPENLDGYIRDCIESAIKLNNIKGLGGLKVGSS